MNEDGALLETFWEGKNRNTRGRTCPIATRSITNPTWTGPASNPGLRVASTAIKRVEPPMCGPLHSIMLQQPDIKALPAYDV
jgi:hypothetical protein